MTRVITIIIFSLSFASLHAQNDETQIRDVIVQLFKGMEKGDSALVKRSFGNDITMATVFRNKKNEVVLERENSAAGFVKAVGTPHKGTWYEEFWGLKIQIDGDFASAWCDYAFYLDNTFSHCGVDAFQLYKTGEGWKIFHLADTRRKEPCEIPSDIQRKHAK